MSNGAGLKANRGEGVIRLARVRAGSACSPGVMPTWERAAVPSAFSYTVMLSASVSVVYFSASLLKTLNYDSKRFLINVRAILRAFL